jgi:cholesterol oxidase
LFGHPEIMVVDGSAISANPGVNPSLTITALAERAMEQVPPVGSVSSVPPVGSVS